MVEPWNKPRENISERRTIPGVVMSNDNYGYADDVFVVSIIRNGDGSIEFMLLLSSEGFGGPSRELLEGVRDCINHHLEHHMGDE